MWADEEIKGKILHKLTRLGKFKHSHTSINNLPKGFPKDIRKRVKEMVKELKPKKISKKFSGPKKSKDFLGKERILFSKPTSYGEEISINPLMKEEILYYINKFLEKE